MIKKSNIDTNNDGYALTYVLFINLLIFSSLLSLAGLMFFYNLRGIKTVIKTKLDLACFSAVQIILSDTSLIDKREFTLVSDSINVLIHVNQYGLFKEIISTASFGKDSSAYDCLIGCDLTQEFNRAITISHPKSMITVAGSNHIIGNIVSASAGITKGNIFGIRNSNDNYTGKILSDPNLQVKLFSDSLITNVFDFNCPEYTNPLTLSTTILDNNFINKNSSNQNYIIDGNLIIKDSICTHDNRRFSFWVLGSTNFINNSYSNLNLTIHCNSLIQVGSNCRIENTLLVSKTGICCYESSFKNAQLLSLDSIIINNSYFSYPSVAANYVNTSDSSKLNSHVKLVNTIFNGSILQVNSIAGLNLNKSKIIIDNESRVQGIVYSDGNVEFLGDLYGSIYTYNFYYYKQPSEYINWLADVNINREKLDNWFLTPIGFNSGKNYEIITGKWLY